VVGDRCDLRGPWDFIPLQHPMKTIYRLVLLTAFVILGSSLSAQTTGATPVAANVAGTWDATVQTDQGSGSPVFEFKQEGVTLTGNYKGQLGEAPLTGKIADNAITFSFVVDVGEKATVEYAAVVDGDTMKGTVKLGTLATGTFTAKKRGS
jgi:hypothetical protein